MEATNNYSYEIAQAINKLNETMQDFTAQLKEVLEQQNEIVEKQNLILSQTVKEFYPWIQK